MNRVRAGYPSQLDDLATLGGNRRIRCVFSTREVTVAFTTPRILFLLFSEPPFARVSKTGCRGAIRTPVPGFKVQGPATRRPGITLSAILLSCTVCTTLPIHRCCGRACCDPYGHDPPIRDDPLLERSKAPMQARFQSLRVQSFVYS